LVQSPPGRIFTIFFAKKAKTRHSMMDGVETPLYNNDIE
jgi:hypothetical protein